MLFQASSALKSPTGSFSNLDKFGSIATTNLNFFTSTMSKNELVKDLSSDTHGDEGTAASTSAVASYPRGNGGGGGNKRSISPVIPYNKLLFPFKLRALLDDAESEGQSDVVSWLPHGQAFRVHKPKEFAEGIMKRHFRQTQFKSFTRQLYHYGFGKVDSGSDRGAFYHPDFNRDDPSGCFNIERKNSKKSLSRQHKEEIYHRLGRLQPSMLSNTPSTTSGREGGRTGGLGLLPSHFEPLDQLNNAMGQRHHQQGSSSSSSSSCDPLDPLNHRSRTQFVDSSTTTPYKLMMGGSTGATTSSTMKDDTTSSPPSLSSIIQSSSKFPSEVLGGLFPSSRRGAAAPAPSTESDWFSSLENYFERSGLLALDGNEDTDVFDLEPRPLPEESTMKQP